VPTSKGEGNGKREGRGGKGEGRKGRGGEVGKGKDDLHATLFLGPGGLRIRPRMDVDPPHIVSPRDNLLYSAHKSMKNSYFIVVKDELNRLLVINY